MGERTHYNEIKGYIVIMPICYQLTIADGCDPYPFLESTGDYTKLMKTHTMLMTLTIRSVLNIVLRPNIGL